MARFAFLAGAVFFLLSVAGISADIPGTDPAEGVFFDQYYSIYIGQVKCGWSHSTFTRKGDTVAARVDTLIKMARGQMALKIVHQIDTTETIAGRPMVFSSKMSMNGLETVRQGFIENDTVTMTITQAGQTARQRFAIPYDAVMSWGERLNAIRAGTKAGSKYTVKLFDPQLGPGQLVHCTAKILGPTQVIVGGKTISGLKAITTIDKPIPMKMTSVLDEQGLPIVSEIPLGAIRLKMVACDKAQAITDVATKELFVRAFVHLDRPLMPAYFRITFTGDDAIPFTVPQTAFQKIVSKGAKQIVVKLLAQTAMYPLQTRPATVSHAYLADSTYVNLKDPLLIKLAKNAGADSDPPLARAQKLCRFVYRYIEQKDLSVAFAPALHVAKIRQGDCTEHAVLLASLARIAGIPTRAVLGLAYIPTAPHGAFAYHMWTQCFIGGQWVDFDATLGRLSPTRTRIALAVSDLSDESFIRDTMKIVHLLGQLKIEQIEPPRPAVQTQPSAPTE